jgi:Ni,Fe-hydrogenase I cytochrome b subunit
MANSFLDDLREQLEQVKNPVLFFVMMFGVFFVIGTLALTGIYFYTRD